MRKRSARLFAASVLSLSAASSLFAQHPAFRRFGLDDGLPQSQVTALLEDRNGFLWVGTNAGGVARLGASGFKPFGAQQGVRARSIRALLEDPEGAIWAASVDGGVSEIRGGLVRNYGPREGLGTSQAFALALDPEGHVIVGTSMGLFRHAAAAFERVELPAGWAHATINLLARDPKGGVWMATRQGLFGRWDGRVLTPAPLPATVAGASLLDIGIDPDGRPWLLTPAALLALGSAGWRDVSLPGVTGAPRLLKLRIDSRGGFLVAMGSDGIFEMHPDGSAEILTEKDGLSKERTLVALKDRGGALWVGTDGGGLAVRALPRLRTLDASAASTDLGAVMRIQELGRGDFLLAGSEGLIRWQEGRGIAGRWGRAEGLPSSEVWTLAPHRDAGFWIGTDRGLAHWKDGRIIPGAPAALAKEAVYQLVRHQERVWAGCEHGLFEIDERAGAVVRHRPPPELGTETIATLVADGDDLLLGTLVGVWTYSQSRFEKRFPDAPFAGQSITCLMREASGRLWVGTAQGLYVQAGSGWESLGLSEGMLDNNISFVADLGHGRVAAGHSKGISFWDGSAVQHLTHGQGLLSDETNHDGFLLDSQGRLWIGMIGGANILEGAATFRNPPLHRPTLVEAAWPSGARVFPRRLVLPPRPESLRLAVDLGAPVLPAPPRYETFLEGLDRGWRPTEQGNVLQYVNMAAGDYRFRLRASLDGRSWVEGEAVLLHVSRGWWETWWFRCVAALAGIGLLAMAVRRRLGALRRHNAELATLVADRTRELVAANEAIRAQSLTDPLTGLRNRRYVSLAIPEDVARAQRTLRELAKRADERLALKADLVFFMVDVDHFKEVNDRFGHGAGDQVLVQVAQILREATREADSVIRWGGEEFLVVARDACRRDAHALAERIRSAVDRHRFDVGGGRPLHRTCSTGFAAYPFHPGVPDLLSWEQTIDLADQCLLAAKRGGRDAWVGILTTESAGSDAFDGGIARRITELLGKGLLEAQTSFPGERSLAWEA